MAPVPDLRRVLTIPQLTNTSTLGSIYHDTRIWQPVPLTLDVFLRTLKQDCTFLQSTPPRTKRFTGKKNSRQPEMAQYNGRNPLYELRRQREDTTVRRAKLPVRYALEALAASLDAFHITSGPQDADGYVPPVLQVFGVTELLEMILAYLPAKKIILSQRVCKAFQNCYQTSKQLQNITMQRVAYNHNGPGISMANGAAESGQLRMNQLVLKQSLEVGQMSLPGSQPPTANQIFTNVDISGVELIRVFYHGATCSTAVRVRFDDTGDTPIAEDTIHQGSWRNLHISDPARPIYLSVAHQARRVSQASSGETITTTTLEATAILCPCTIGQLLEVAKMIKRALRLDHASDPSKRNFQFHVAQDGDSSIYAISKELLSLMHKGTIIFHRGVKQSRRRMG